MSSRSHVREHRIIPRAVHDAGGKIAMQILHAGRYAFTPFCVGPTALKSPISRFKPRALTAWGVERTIRAFVRSAVLAREAGYDGVEIMGSEGYLINQFLVADTTSASTDGVQILNGDAAFPRNFDADSGGGGSTCMAEHAGPCVSRIGLWRGQAFGPNHRGSMPNSSIRA